MGLCFKETTIRSNEELTRSINECKSLYKFYSKYYVNMNVDNMVALYMNKRKTSNVYPRKVRVVMKYHDGEDLDDYLVDEEDGEVGFLYENDFRQIMKKILIQLSILHSQGVLHCDLTPHNIRYLVIKKNIPFYLNVYSLWETKTFLIIQIYFDII